MYWNSLWRDTRAGRVRQRGGRARRRRKARTRKGVDIWCQRKGNREGGSEIAGAQALYDDGGFARKSQCSATPFGSHPLLAVPSLYRPLSFLATASSILYSRQIPTDLYPAPIFVYSTAGDFEREGRVMIIIARRLSSSSACLLQYSRSSSVSGGS